MTPSEKREEAITSLFNVSALLDPMRLRAWDSEGLTVTQLRLLRFLHEQEGRSNAELAELLYVTRPSVSALLDRLERGGFIRREVSKQDRRGIRIWLEERGRQAFLNVRAESRDYVRDLMSSLSDDEIDDVIAVMRRVAESGREARQRALREAQAAEPA